MKRYLPLVLLLCQIWTFGYGQQAFIQNVPDNSQPPAMSLPFTLDPTNYCTPFAFLNIIEYWDVVQSHPQAKDLMAGLPPEVVAEYIGWFMDTNNLGSPLRANGVSFIPAKGTYAGDQLDGALEFIAFDTLNIFGYPDPVPPQKQGYTWKVSLDTSGSFTPYTARIDSGYPVKVDFSYWHVQPTGNIIFLPNAPGEPIHVYRWGALTNNSGFDPEAPPEEWNLEQKKEGIGHAVTGVGYLIDTLDFAIVHDNWANTPKLIAIPWQNITAMLFANPGLVVSIAGRQLTTPHFRLRQNYPNPFNPVTTIEFSLPSSAEVILAVYNLLGEKVATLVSEKLPAGNHRLRWEASSLAGGLYFYRLKTARFSDTKKLLLLK